MSLQSLFKVGKILFYVLFFIEIIKYTIFTRLPDEEALTPIYV